MTITGGSASGPIANYNPLSRARSDPRRWPADSTADPLSRPGDGAPSRRRERNVGPDPRCRGDLHARKRERDDDWLDHAHRRRRVDEDADAGQDECAESVADSAGDPASTAVQWDAAANSSAQTMSAAARVFPVQDGWGTLAPGQTGGVRFRVNQGLLDVKSLNLTGPPPGRRSSAAAARTSPRVRYDERATTTKGQLQQTLADYNAANPTQRADLALGVIKDDFAWPTNNTVGLVCDDGRAMTPVAGAPGAVGWVRLSTTNAYPTPGLMEIAHNLGIQRLIPGVNTSFLAERRGRRRRAGSGLQRRPPEGPPHRRDARK